MKGTWKKFVEFADSTFTYLVKLARYTRQLKASRLDFVADRYPEISIKNAERARRAAQRVQTVHVFNNDESIPKQWEKYLSCGKNKEGSS